MINKAGKSLFFLLLIWFCCISPSRAQSTFIKHYSTKDGLPSNHCYYTLQDKKGYIWVASDAGLSRFDGKVFETFSVDDGLPDNQIIRLNEDKKGRLWLSALNGQLSYIYEGKVFSAKNDRLLKLLSFNAIVISFFEDSKGNIWFGTNKNILIKWDGKSVVRYTSACYSSQFINTFVYEDSQGRIWASSSHALHLFNGSTFHKLDHYSSPISYKTALNQANGTMLFLNEQGLNVRNGIKENLSLKIDSKILSANPGYFYAEDPSALWLSNNAGVYYIRANEPALHYLPNIICSQVIRDSKGNMWFTTSNGLYMLPQKEKRIYYMDRNHGLSNNVVKSLMKDRYNKLWLGLENGFINILTTANSKIDILNLPDKNKFNSIKQLAADASGNSVLFSSDYGLGLIDVKRNGKINYLRETSNYGFVLKNFSLSNKNELAMSLSSGVVIIPDPFHNLTFSSSRYKEGKNYFSGRSYRVFYDDKEALWFSNSAGFSEFFNQTLLPHYKRNNLLTKRINDIAELNDGTMVLATDGYGVLFFRGQTLIRQITRENGLSNNICKKLFIRDGYIWVVTNNAVNRIFMKGKFPVESFDYTNSLLDNDVNELFINSDTAYFATNHGLIFFANKPYDKTQEVPNVLISAIISNKQSLPVRSGAINLSPDDNNITFYYSAIDFQNNNIVYRYRIKNTSSWTETKNRRIEFSALEPGRYTFEISARTNNSEWSKAVNQAFVLHEHFWQSPWFMGFLLLIVSFSFYKIAVRVTKQQKDKEQQSLMLRHRILMLEQQALQAMMNPHFVFNVMNSIQHYINTKDTSSANKILTGFARLIRKNLDICTKSFISVEEELEYLTLYLSLEKKRFGEKFRYQIVVDQDIDQDETMLPSMILQPYIENAIWHGIMPMEAGGEISVLINTQQPDALLIQIIDNGIGIDNSMRTKREDHQSKGMSLTQERINLINQIESKPIQISVVQNGDSGTTISILLPKR